MNRLRYRVGLGFFLTFFAWSGVAQRASAQLEFYYDPLTGNVSFDTSHTRSGVSYSYGLNFGSNSSLEFRYENHIRLSNSSLYFSEPNMLSDNALSPPFEGLYTIGDVLPVGLTEVEWTNLFPVLRGLVFEDSHTYTDVIGGGSPPPAKFIYGLPEGEFDNKWDLVDPNTLDWAQAAKLIYRPHSGELLIDTSQASGGYISSYWLSSNGEFLTDDYDPIVDSALGSATDSDLGLFADAIEPGLYSLGEVLAPGLSQSEFESVFTLARYLGQAGFAGGSFDLQANGQALSLVYSVVPEPSTLMLALVALWVPTRVRKGFRVNTGVEA